MPLDSITFDMVQSTTRTRQEHLWAKYHMGKWSGALWRNRTSSRYRLHQCTNQNNSDYVEYLRLESETKANIAQAMKGDNEFKVTDISEMGLRTYSESRVSVGYKVCGTITLLCDEPIGVEGMTVRENQVHLYMSFKIPDAMFLTDPLTKHCAPDILFH